MAEHLFKPGQSGNPAGRPKGSSDKRMELRGMLESKGKEVIQKVIEMALEGDSAAMKLVMERICPKPKTDSVNLGIQVNSLGGQRDIRQVVSEVLLSALKGEVPDDQSKAIASLVKAVSDIDTRIEDSKRLDAIEEKLGINNG